MKINTQTQNRSLFINIVVLGMALLLLLSMMPAATVSAQENDPSALPINLKNLVEDDHVHGEDDDHHHEEATTRTTNVESVKKLSVQMSIVSSIVIALLVIFAMLIREPSNNTKKFLFISMVIFITVPTLYFVISTIYINIISETKGPVHWHADFEIFVCGEQQEPPQPPTRFSNKTGTPVLHEHEDRRLHVEGVLIKKSDASLANFFAVQGGELTKTSFKIPVATGFREVRNGDSCPEGPSGQWQAFLYQTIDGRTKQQKLENYTDYILSPYAFVPPGDCVIFEFDTPKDKTEHICDFYAIDIEKGNLILEE